LSTTGTAVGWAASAAEGRWKSSNAAADESSSGRTVLNATMSDTFLLNSEWDQRG